MPSVVATTLGGAQQALWRQAPRPIRPGLDVAHGTERIALDLDDGDGRIAEGAATLGVAADDA